MKINSTLQIFSEAKWSPLKRNWIASTSIDNSLVIWNVESSSSQKSIIKIPTLGEIDCIAWNKTKENVLAITCNNDIRIYDIRVRIFF